MGFKKLSSIFLLMSFCLYGCSLSSPYPSPVYTAIPTPSATPSPTAAPTPTIVPRWILYEKALSKALMGSEGYLCEWEIYGVSKNEVYVWARCAAQATWGSSVSSSAVIYLSNDGGVERVALPSKGLVTSYDLIQTLFPTAIQPTILAHGFDNQAAENSFNIRRKTYGPPLLVTQGTPLP